MKKIVLLISASICAVGTFMAMENGTEATENQKANAAKKLYCIYDEKNTVECIIGEGPYCIANIVNGECIDIEIKPEN